MNSHTQENFAHDFTRWNHVSDKDFLNTDRFTYNDETKTYHTSYSTIRDGEVTVVGVSGSTNIGLPYFLTEIDSRKNTSSRAGDIWEGTLLATGVLLADDITGIGVVDDVLIPVVFTGGAIAAGAAWLYDQFASEHSKNKQNKSWNKHTKPRAGRETTKNRQDKDWKKNPNKKSKKGGE